MSYHKITSFAVKDTMADNNPLKVIRGKEFDDEFDAITTAMDTQEEVIANLVTTPVGGIIMYSLNVAPNGFLMCDGSAKSRNTYIGLFQAIGTTFGAGDGSTTFNVPNLSNRFPYGGALGQLGGSADSSLPSHSHAATSTVSDPGHAHSYTKAAGTSPQSGASTQVLTNETTATTSASLTNVSVNTTIGSAGSSPINANLPPFIGLAFIIKI